MGNETTSGKDNSLSSGKSKVKSISKIGSHAALFQRSKTVAPSNSPRKTDYKVVTSKGKAIATITKTNSSTNSPGKSDHDMNKTTNKDTNLKIQPQKPTEAANSTTTVNKDVVKAIPIDSAVKKIDTSNAEESNNKKSKNLLEEANDLLADKPVAKKRHLDKDRDQLPKKIKIQRTPITAPSMMRKRIEMSNKSSNKPQNTAVVSIAKPSSNKDSVPNRGGEANNIANSAAKFKFKPNGMTDTERVKARD